MTRILASKSVLPAQTLVIQRRARLADSVFAQIGGQQKTHPRATEKKQVDHPHFGMLSTANLSRNAASLAAR